MWVESCWLACSGLMLSAVGGGSDRCHNAMHCRHMGQESTAATPTQNGYDLWVGKLAGSGDHWTHMKSSQGPDCNSGLMLGLDMRCVEVGADDHRRQHPYRHLGL